MLLRLARWLHRRLCPHLDFIHDREGGFVSGRCRDCGVVLWRRTEQEYKDGLRIPPRFLGEYDARVREGGLPLCQPYRKGQ